MSLAVELAELQERVAEYGPVAFVVTVGEDGRPHVVSARVTFDGGAVVAGVGRTTSGNVERNATATVLWPAPDSGDHCLIVDGAGSVDGEGSVRNVVVSPTRAVLHRLPDAPETTPSCITVLDQRP